MKIQQLIQDKKSFKKFLNDLYFDIIGDSHFSVGQKLKVVETEPVGPDNFGTGNRFFIEITAINHLKDDWFRYKFKITRRYIKGSL